MDEKRQHERFTVAFPVRLHAKSGKIEAVCRDGSAGGALVVAGGAKLAIGEKVTIAFARIPGEAHDAFLIGKVVRLEDASANGTHRIAIEFKQPVPELETLFARASSRPPPAADG